MPDDSKPDTAVRSRSLPEQASRLVGLPVDLLTGQGVARNLVLIAHDGRSGHDLSAGARPTSWRRSSAGGARALIEPWNTAEIDARLVRRGAVRPSRSSTAALTRIATGDGRINAFTDVMAERALEEAAAVDAAPGQGAGAAGGRALSRSRTCSTSRAWPTARRLEDQRDGPKATRDALAGARDRGSRRHPARRPQHGRVRLRLHQRERPLRPLRTIRTIRPASAGGSSGGSVPRSPAAWCRWRWAATPTARSACRPRCAACSGSKPTYGRLPRRLLSLRGEPRPSGPVRPHRRATSPPAWDALQGYDPADPAQRSTARSSRRRRC